MKPWFDEAIIWLSRVSCSRSAWKENREKTTGGTNGNGKGEQNIEAVGNSQPNGQLPTYDNCNWACAEFYRPMQGDHDWRDT